MSNARSKVLDLSHHFSKASKRRAPNVLKEYYKFLRVPEMSNLAGGLPYPGNFPFNSMHLSLLEPRSLLAVREKGGDSAPEDPQTHQIYIPRQSEDSKSVHRIDLETALQYGSAQGYPPLHAWIRKLTNSIYHPNIPYEGGADVMINGGSSDGLSKVFELLFDHWDEDLSSIRDRQSLIVEEFVYGPPIAQIKPRNVNIVPVKMDTEGMLAYGPGSLFDVLHSWDYSRGKRPHVVYVIPTGQNPTSGVLLFPRRKEIYEVCSQFDIVLIEDDPYWNLYYPSAQTLSLKHRGVPRSTSLPHDADHNYCTQTLQGRSTGHSFLDRLIPSFLSIDRDGRVIRLDSFSKTISPGCRLGWVTAQPAVCEQIFRITDSTTQQPSGFVQAIVAQMIGDSSQLSGGKQVGWGSEGWVQWLDGLRLAYERRMITMATVFEEHRFIPGEAGRTEMFSFDWPMGGMFLWVKMNIATHPLVSVAQRILVVPGGDFSASEFIKNDRGYLYFRFCFAAVEESLLEAKSQSFTEACRDFWAITDAAVIDTILLEGGVAQTTQGDQDEADREMIEEWE